MKKIVWVVLLLLIAAVSWYLLQEESISNAGKLIEQNQSFDVYDMVFKGDDGKDIYTLLFAPHQKRFDVVIVLPGAGGTKESRRRYAEVLLEKKYGALILDQRGIGETRGYVNSLEEDFDAFMNNKPVHQFSMARDVMQAVDFLEKVKEVNKIAVLGESMGGRNALIAGGLDTRIKGVIAIASAGYRGSTGNSDGDRFLAFINPNSYIGKIAPRRLLMIHAMNDSIIPIEEARYTFSLAREPKRFVEIGGECNHGYCEDMARYIQEEAALIFQS